MAMLNYKRVPVLIILGESREVGFKMLLSTWLQRQSQMHGSDDNHGTLITIWRFPEMGVPL